MYYIQHNHLTNIYPVSVFLSLNFDILIVGKSPIKWRQRPGMTIAVDWDVKLASIQTNKQTRLIEIKGQRF